ncbi:MAG: S41 family peptidase [Gemmatimonadaceae bacterium]
MTRRLLVAALTLSFLPAGGAIAQGTRLLRHPTVSRDQIAFAYGGDLWVVGRGGGQARRLTSTPEVETDPRFSPDGSLIALTRTVGGNSDVYVVSAAGGEARRLTYHPGFDRAAGWSPDGKRVLFSSNRTSAPHSSYLKLWSVPVEGGFEEPLPLPRAFTGAYSPDGQRVAYEEFSTPFVAAWYDISEWRHHRGGRTHPIRLVNLADLAGEKLPWTNSNDTDPMWVGSAVYFLSDRNHTTNLFAYRTDTRQLRQLTQHSDFDIKNATAGPDAIVYEQAGYIHLVDLASGTSKQVNIQVVGDFPWARPQFKRVATMIREFALSPTGVRIAFAARGDIFTVPAEKGDYRNLTQSAGAHDRSPVWAPDGSQLAWLSDASGEYQLMFGDQSGLTTSRAVPLPGASFYSDPLWSPDSKRLLLRDNRLNLWTIDPATGRATKIDTDVFDTPSRQFDAAWSPDSRWIAYTKSLENHLRAIYVYSFADGKSFQLTDGMADAISPAFDAGAKYLYFLASTDYGPRTGWLEMSQLDRPMRRAVYLTVLSANEPSPLLPELGDEPAPPAPRIVPDSARPRTEASAPAAQAAAPTTPTAAQAPGLVRIDTARIRQRILSLNVPAAELSALGAGPAGSVFYIEAVQGGAPRLQRYQLRERAATTFMEGVSAYSISADRKKLLYRTAGSAASARWGVVVTDRPARAGDGAVDVASLEMRVDPRVEWNAIFSESWRYQRDFFYDEKMHGADWQAVRAKYAALLPHVAHRADLGYLVAQTGGELTVGHSYLLGAGDVPTETLVPVGLLGADYAVENGRYRIKRVYTGENWNPELRAPLSAPGIRVSEGDYLLEVNGHAVTPPTNVHQWFEGSANRQTVIRINSQPTMEGSRLVTVVPVASEDGLRARAWIEDNRRKVDQLSGGRLAYVWLPNTGGPGYTYFTRYFYSQQEKEGVIIDERYNQGGMVADFIVSELDRKPMGYFAMRSGKVWTSPAAGIFGPKVMLINESAGSGGDALPYMFRQRQLGPLVGTRTWGGLVGTLGVPATIDGGGITAPSLAFFDLKGRWSVENEGIAPDIEVEYTPAEVNKGRDPQLERAVQEAMKLLQQHPIRQMGRPTPIDRVSKP